MIEISPKNIKRWATIGPRATFGLVISELAERREKLVVVTADVSSSAGLERFSKFFPERLVDVGIAEQNMIGVAAGLADSGYEVFTTTFAPFQTLRCLDQIKVNLAYSNMKVVMVGLASGLVNWPAWHTHSCIEDIGALRSLPNMTILSPADGLGVAKSLLASLEWPTPIYIRLTGGANNGVVYHTDLDYKIGKAIEIRPGSDITIFSSGSTVFNSVAAADMLATRGVSAGVVDMHTIKPLDVDAVTRAAGKSKLLVSIEEHNVIGGLGTAIAEVLAALPLTPPLFTMGVKDVFMPAGAYPYLLEECDLCPERILEKILTKLEDL